MRWNWLIILSLAAIAAACGDDDDGSAGDGGPDGSTDTDTDTDADSGTDTETDPPDVCADLELPVIAFTDVEESTALRATAADFTLSTTAGDWSLKDNWSGCDAYLFLPENPNQNQGAYGYHYWDNQGDFDDMFAASPRNVHYFFVPGSTSDVDEVLGALEEKVAAAIGALPAEDEAWWADRVHFVTEKAADMGNYVGDLLTSPRFGFGIDRAQRIRYVGSFGDPARYSSAVGWFGPNVSMVTNEAIFYNFEAEREERLAAEEATVVELWNTTPVAPDGPFDVDVELPDADAMAGFDTLEFDMAMACGAGEYGACPAWDYDVYLYVCDAADPTTCTTEIGHWITSYHRVGRWVHDASAVLPLLAAGGSRRFRIGISDDWEITLSLRFSNQGKAAAPSETYALFAGQYTFDESYNANFPDVVMAVPSDAVKVELATAITGHGMSMPGNCCEFASTEQHFWVNDTDNMQENTMAGDELGCMEQVADGTVPNQYGTWWYGRNGWCPGKHVPIVMTDVTSQVELGADNTFGYEAYLNGDPYTGDNWRHIHITSWLVISR
jgi:hypothetical protein